MEVPRFPLLAPVQKEVLGGGLEPPCLAAYAPQTYVSAISPPEQGVRHIGERGILNHGIPWRKHSLRYSGAYSRIARNLTKALSPAFNASSAWRERGISTSSNSPLSFNRKSIRATAPAA